jgi:uncharacterized membrane-anchored protein YhcB (DUF1043 family)
MSEQLPEVPEAPETPVVEAPSVDGPSERVYPKDTADLLDDYFGSKAQARLAEEEQETVEAIHQAGYDEALSDDEEYSYPEQPEVDLSQVETVAELQELIDTGAVSDEQLREFVREGVREELQPGLDFQAEYVEERQQRLQQQQAEYQQEQSEGFFRAADVVRGVHRGYGSLNQHLTLLPTLESAARLYDQLLAEGYTAENLQPHVEEIVRTAAKPVAEETQRRNMALRLAGRRTDTGERER